MNQQLLRLKGKLIRRNNGTKLALAPTPKLPNNTLRFRFSQSTTDPTSIENGGTWTKVINSKYNDWDWTCDDTNWGNKFSNKLTELLDPNIQIIAGNTSNVTDTQSMFSSCTSLTTVPLFDTSSTFNMVAMFDSCTSLTTVPLFDTSNVKYMDGMFNGCTSLTTVPLFDTSNAPSMNGMFTGCTKVESGALALYQQASATGKVTSHSNTFKDCGKDTETGLAELQQIPEDWGGLKAGILDNTLRFRFSQSSTDPTSIENGGTWTKVSGSSYNDWDWTCNDTNWGDKFSYKLTRILDPNIQIIAAGDTSSVINMESMFDKCESLKSVQLFDTSNVTYMSYMFRDCKALTSVPLFDTSSVIKMDSMFNGCTSLTTVPLFDTSNVNNMENMFFACIALTSVPLFDTSNVKYIGRMFTGCTKVESGALALYQQASATGKVTSHSNTFKDCGKDTETGLAELQQIPEDWGGLKNEMV